MYLTSSQNMSTSRFRQFCHIHGLRNSWPASTSYVNQTTHFVCNRKVQHDIGRLWFKEPDVHGLPGYGRYSFFWDGRPQQWPDYTTIFFQHDQFCFWPKVPSKKFAPVELPIYEKPVRHDKRVVVSEGFFDNFCETNLIWFFLSRLIM